MLRKVVRSMNLCASTDIRLTTSPTVDERLAALVIARAYKTIIGRKINLTLNQVLSLWHTLCLLWDQMCLLRSLLISTSMHVRDNIIVK